MLFTKEIYINSETGMGASMQCVIVTNYDFTYIYIYTIGLQCNFPKCTRKRHIHGHTTIRCPAEADMLSKSDGIPDQVGLLSS